jgi:hypothetical protein
MLDVFQTETALFDRKREEYFPMKPFAMVVLENVTTRYNEARFGGQTSSDIYSLNKYS